MKIALSILLLGSLSLSACDRREDDAAVAAADFTRSPDHARSGLERAHHAYAAGAARAMTRDLLNVLEDADADDTARANAVALADTAFAEGQGRLDTGFEIPAGMTWMRLVFQRAENDGTPSYLAILNGGLEPGVEVESLEIVRVQGERTLASKVDALGHFETGFEAGKPYFYLHSATASFPLESGAYRIRWAYVDGRSGSADVLVPTFRFDALPEILAPARGAVVSSQPTLRFRAPSGIGEDASGAIVLAASITTPTVERGPRWSFWELGATRTEATLGTVGTPAGATLEAGKTYSLAVSYDFRLQYGQLQLGSSVRRSHVFSTQSNGE
ncbi:Hypothetical protein A7982_01260 [Minicystis rosea]|nr:Hypothetical protein A7982_01260 [Minicystis rosea]